MSPEVIQSLTEKWGLNRPILDQYLSYMVNLVKGDFGISFRSSKPVSQEIIARLPNTIALITTAVLIATALRIVIGIYLASKRGGKLDTSLTPISVVISCLPIFWVGMMMILFFSFRLGLFPPAGTVSPPPNNPTDTVSAIRDYLWHLALPLSALTLILVGEGLLGIRNLALDTLSQDYVVTARAKGVKERSVLYKHVFKNLQLPIVTQLSVSLAQSFGGAIVTETVFGWYGMGRYIFESIANRDYPALQGSFFVLTLVVILANLFADLTYGVLDPRVKAEGSASRQ